jgi:hypothetical protein
MAIIGRNAKLSTSTDGSTYYDAGYVLSANKGGSMDLADNTTNDSGGYKENVYADQQTTFDVTVKYDSSNTSQLQMIDEFYSNHAGIYIRFRPQTSSGVEKQWIALCRISSLNIDTSTSDVEEMSVTFESTGTVTYQTQP